MWTKAVFFTISISGIFYLLLIFAFTEGWNRLGQHNFSHRNLSTAISIIIPFRNEGEKPAMLLQKLLKQTYPHTLTEIIFVDDHSEDDGVRQLKNLLSIHPESNIKIITSAGKGKKAALYSGLLQAGGKLIFTTDADTTPTPNWLTVMVAMYEEKRPRMILGPVVYQTENTIFRKFFSLDFMSLVASGAGSTGLGLPFMGNAANMAFEKQLFTESYGKTMNTGFTSGDDVFFIQYVQKTYGRKAITFIKNEDAIVQTPPPENLSAFLKQRIRWSSKARGYTQPWAVLVSYVIFIFNFFLSLLLITGIFLHWTFIIYLLFIIMKTLVDFPLLYAFSRFTGKRHLLLLLFPFEIIYPVYITFAAFRGLFPYEWKNRQWNQ